MQIELNPFDTLFFRDGKPFERGDEVWANGVFPPAPSVVYGALRTTLLSRNLDWLSLAGGPDDPTRALRIKAFLLQQDGKVYFPCPYDVVYEKEDKDDPQLLSLEKRTFLSSFPMESVLVPPSEQGIWETMGGNHFVSYLDFNQYLQKTQRPLPIKANDFLKKEPKIGIQKSRMTGSSEEGRLYRVELLRLLENTGFYLDVELPESTEASLSTAGIINIGGEGKSVGYKLTNAVVDISLPELEGEFFKLVFATPACFEQGWLPKGIDPITMKGEWCGQQVKILTVASDRPVYLGGFAMKTAHQAGGPKPMRRAIPAGTVYFLKIMKGETQEVAKAFHNQCISDYGLDREGFGLTFVGKIK